MYKAHHKSNHPCISKLLLLKLAFFVLVNAWKVQVHYQMFKATWGSGFWTHWQLLWYCIGVFRLLITENSDHRCGWTQLWIQSTGKGKRERSYKKEMARAIFSPVRPATSMVAVCWSTNWTRFETALILISRCNWMVFIREMSTMQENQCFSLIVFRFICRISMDFG